LVELDESKRVSLIQIENNQEKVKNTFDHKEKERGFIEGYLVLLWDKRRDKSGMRKKLDGL
jgi:flagellar hook assembly protein FlgD